MNIPDINEAIDQWLLRKRAQEGKYRAAHNNAHSLGDLCTRKCVYARLYPDKATDHDADTLSIFEIGSEFEAIYKRWIENAGFDITYQQVNAYWASVDVSGHTDGIIPYKGNKFVIEIKSMAPWPFNKAKSLKDFVNPDSDRWRDQPAFLHRNLCQLVLYLLLHEQEHGLLLIINKTGKGRKQFYVALADWLDLGERLLQRAELINQYVAEKELPDRINKLGYCDQYCEFYEECRPALTYGPGIRIIEDEDVIEAINFCAIAHEEYKEYNRKKTFVNTKCKTVLADGQDREELITPDGLRVEVKRKANGIECKIITPEE